MTQIDEMFLRGTKPALKQFEGRFVPWDEAVTLHGLELLPESALRVTTQEWEDGVRDGNNILGSHARLSRRGDL